MEDVGEDLIEDVGEEVVEVVVEDVVVGDHEVPKIGQRPRDRLKRKDKLQALYKISIMMFKLFFL